MAGAGRGRTLTDQPTPRQIALAVAALQHGAWVEYDAAHDEWYYDHPHSTPTSWGGTLMLALATVAETEKWEPDPQVWGNHLRLQAIDADAAVMAHYVDCPNDCGLGGACAEADELREASREARTALIEFEGRRKTDG